MIDDETPGEAGRRNGLDTPTYATREPASEVESPESREVSVTTNPHVPAHAAEEAASSSTSIRDMVEWIAVVVVALVAALVIREYFIQAFEIPSQSMEDTVNVGDRILVNKLSYSFGDVSRGDLVVFSRGTLTSGNTDELIKRAIALPGETVELRSDGLLYLWGPGEGPEDAIQLDEPYLADGLTLRPPRATDSVQVDLWDERCANPREPGRCTLDDSSYFMMGDNRFNSTDSRSFGPVPEDNIVGRAFLRIWPLRAISGL